MSEHIKIGNVVPRIRYIADGEQTGFIYPFPIFKEDDLKVWIDSNLVETGYVISGAGLSEGGEVTFNTAPLSGAVITLIRRVVAARTSDFQTGGAFRAKVINDELDFQTAAIQQIEDDVSRAVRLSPYAPDTNMELPIPDAGKALLWNEDGSGIINSNSNFNTITNEMANQVGIATTQAGLANTARIAAQAAQSGAETARFGAEQAKELSENARDAILDDEGVQVIAADLIGDNNIGTVADDLNGANKIGLVGSNIDNINACGSKIDDIEVCSENIDDIKDAATLVSSVKNMTESIILTVRGNEVTSHTLVDAGTGYQVGDILFASGGDGSRARFEVTAVGAGGEITAVTRILNGSYIENPTNPVGTTGGSGSGASFNLTLNNSTADYKDLATACYDVYNKYYPKAVQSGVLVRLDLATTYIMAKPLIIAYGINMGFIRINLATSNRIDPTLWTNQAAFSAAYNSILPTYIQSHNRVFDMYNETNANGLGVDGLYLTRNSSMCIQGSSDGYRPGIRNASRYGVYCFEGGVANLSWADFTGATTRGLYADQCGVINANRVSARTVTGENNTNDIVATRGGIITGRAISGGTNITVNDLSTGALILTAS